ncbi:MAG: TetR family transcriptional regulator [Catenulispora sp. 13_1_20CM_3_70_7]|nr:TetR family transcriptional regulator [Catenulisporales bacterium]OLE27123.1 MAG: TetR family transcriptional regulator [Catenulispora sp. 13_1_20CM_3_70_7]
MAEPSEARTGPTGSDTGAPRDRGEKLTARGDERKALILDTALRLFERDGYEKTTMRAIAREAGVSVGNAYYYFDSKDHLIQAFYDEVSDHHIVRALTSMRPHRDLGARLAADLHAWIDVAEPYRAFATQFVKNAVDPNSPLSPFSPESKPTRDKVIEVHRRVVLGSNAKIDPEIAESLPDLLWMHHMGIVLFWVYDRSPDARRTRELVDRTAPMVARVIRLSRFKMVRPLFREADKLIRDFLLPGDEPADRG